MKGLAVVVGIVLLFALLYVAGFLGTFNECLEWDGRHCIAREVNPETTWPVLRP